MFDTIKGFYTNIHRAKSRAANEVKHAEAEIADARRHIAALATGLLDEEKTKLEAWLKSNPEVARAAE